LWKVLRKATVVLRFCSFQAIFRFISTSALISVNERKTLLRHKMPQRILVEEAAAPATRLSASSDEVKAEDLWITFTRCILPWMGFFNR